MEAIKIVASQLLKFTIRDAEAQGVGAVAQQQQKNGTYLEELIKAMPLLRSLTIGFDGVELSSLFTLLAKLKHLRYFVLRHNKDSPTPLDTHLSQLDFSNLSAWLASPPSSLRMVGLPVGLLRDEWWEENEFGDRRSAVLEKGVELCLVD
ncbi:hypothetical protein BCR35DRAFT_83339 [Leucosporidium creatinivorum]|uniref:F-box domain-containing protein n=1 Tax=Leucosporidium creatinivorum TaxID=106004 RepID=A0A1Y2FG60_9BASI|nr:hypothetical protein BCR35DRAFT_83339 [Leucosporidium creatinivorum]